MRFLGLSAEDVRLAASVRLVLSLIEKVVKQTIRRAFQCSNK